MSWMPTIIQFSQTKHYVALEKQQNFFAVIKPDAVLYDCTLNFLTEFLICLERCHVLGADASFSNIYRYLYMFKSLLKVFLWMSTIVQFSQTKRYIALAMQKKHIFCSKADAVLYDRILNFRPEFLICLKRSHNMFLERTPHF